MNGLKSAVLFLLLIGGLGLNATARAQDDDEEELLIIIEDDEEEGVTEQTPPPSDIGQFWEDNILFQTKIRQDVFGVGRDALALGSLSSLEVTSGYLSDHLELHLNGLWRWWVPQVSDVDADNLGDWAAWYEFYLKQSWGRYFHLQVGKQMVPWGHTQVFSLGDRLQPAYRTHGAAFLEPVKGSEPLWGASLRTQASILSSEFVLMFPWNAERNYLTADQQGHYQFGRYQEALGRSDPLGNMSRIGAYMEETTALDQLAAGLRVQGQIDEITLGVSGVWGPDQTPVLLGAPADYQYFMTSLDPTFVSGGCGADGCPLVNTDPLFTRAKVASTTLDATWGFGLAIIKMEWLHYLAEVPGMGKNILVWEQGGLRSMNASFDAVALALESGLGEFIEGSLELALFRWGQLPQNTFLFGVEPMDSDTSTRQEYYRPAFGTRLNGYLWPQWVSWSLANETGLQVGDHQSKFELALHWPDTTFFVGAFTEWFVGPVGTPGYFRQNRSRSGLMIGGGPW